MARTRAKHTRNMSADRECRPDDDCRIDRHCVCGLVQPSPLSVRKPPSLSERLAFRDYEPTLSLSCSNRLEGFVEPLFKLITQLATVIKVAITANRYASTLTCPYRSPLLGQGGLVRVASLSIHWAVTNYVTNLNKRTLGRLSTC